MLKDETNYIEPKEGFINWDRYKEVKQNAKQWDKVLKKKEC